MWRRWGGAALVLAMLVPATPAVAAGPRLFKVDAARADWAIWRGDGRFRVWVVEAARYQDLTSGEVRVFARAVRMECTGSDNPLSCRSSGVKTTTGVPETFEFAPDMSRASVELGPHHVEWVADDPVDDPLPLVPYPYLHEEGCSEGSGNGSGLFREMHASGRVFGYDASGAADDSDPAFIGSYVLETECDPSAWWDGGRALRSPQWLRRAETSSFLSMLDRPAIPTSFAFS